MEVVVGHGWMGEGGEGEEEARGEREMREGGGEGSERR